MDLPIYYDYENANNFYHSGTIKSNNTRLVGFFAKYLLNDCWAAYKFTLPENWVKGYYLYCEFCLGRIAVLETDKFGIIPQHCGLWGRNVQYAPIKAVIANPLLKGLKTPIIDKECTVVKIQDNYSGIMDIVLYYADLMAVAAESVFANLFQTKLGYVFRSGNKATAETMKAMFDDIMNGKMAVFADKQMFDENGNPTWDFFQNNLKQNYVVTEILADVSKIRNEFLTKIGIPNVNIEKRERTNLDEVNANNLETRVLADIIFDNISDGFERTRKMFGYTRKQLNIEWNSGYAPEERQASYGNGQSENID